MGSTQSNVYLGNWLSFAFLAFFCVSQVFAQDENEVSESTTTDLNSFVASLSEKVSTLLDVSSVPGAAVAIFQAGEVVFMKGYGFADEEHQVPVTPQTGFNIGSISKTVAAWGVMKLVEEGKLNLDSPVEQYLTRWHIPASEFDATGVTVRRLLSHTAGLSLHGYPGWGPDDELPSLEDSLSGATNGRGDVRLVAEPGTLWQYSGGGYTLLQLLIEEVSGRPFADYMQEEILAPLGMHQSSYSLTSEILAGSSLAYDELGEPTPNPRFTATAAAGLHTTIEDLAIFATSVVSNREGAQAGRGILSEESIALMLARVPVSEDRWGLGYALGFVFDDGDVLMGHGGSNRGWQSLFYISPERGDGFAVVTNGSNGWNVDRIVLCSWIEWQIESDLSCNWTPIYLALTDTLKEEGVESAIALYRSLKAQQSDTYRFREAYLNQLGLGLLDSDRVQDAIALLRLNVEEYPEAWNPYDSLAFAYEKAGETELAIENYRKSLELNPENTNAVEMLEKLGSP